ncbi:transmembrane protein 131-like isoform X2 [Dinothrombium tinctorium]|uniref:Transmembrane protein 131-like isoform X2 n=1 Tax=Dinothrombium tinctorium TaxID=1965070 RepID=A0A3S3PH11_9ACAR|nr:transmembrane protein 131-like isoform X2 [Dinothrombium tinctorium]RWS15102.1 transmembrane protein 131-like isoform X2 [Dinothrombium tinctorium]
MYLDYQVCGRLFSAALIFLIRIDYVLGELLANSNVIRNGRLIINAELEESSNDYESDQDLSKIVNTVHLNENPNLIRFTPQKLHFKQHSVGIPYVKKVVIENPQDISIQMLSISGNTVHFHCSFFEDKIMQPNGNTSFDVVFLARQEGFVSNTLYIHTSIGSFKYQVSAIGVPNPYRLRPLVGAKVPLNSSYSPIIHIYNPHTSTLQLTEMYSTGGGLHLELPNGNNDGTKDLWQIAPFETKAVMRANFLARSERNHTAYIRIKTNASDDETKQLILPVEVEVSSAPGLYSPVDVLDFGVTRSTDESLKLSLQILNAGTKTITIQNVIATPVNEALDIEFSSVNPVRVSPNIYHPMEIAKVTLEPKKITNCLKQCSGKIVVKSKNNQYKLAIPYQVTLLSGHLGYNHSQTQFYIPPFLNKKSDEEKRVLHISSYFNFSLVVHSVSLPDEAKPYFKITLIEPMMKLKPNETMPLATITFTPCKQLTRLQTYFRLHTNISYFDISLNAYSGKLEVFVPHSLNQTILNFGTIGLHEEKSLVFSVVNNNPVDVKIKNWGCNISKAHVDLIGIEEGNVTAIAQKTNYSHLQKQNLLKLKPKHFAIFKLYLSGFDKESNFYGETFVETDFEVLKVSFVGRAIEGSLSGDNIFISNSFPGRVSSQTIRISCSFTSDVALKSVSILPKDETRFSFEPHLTSGASRTVLKFGENIIGKLFFDPYKLCGHLKSCYTGLETSKEGNLFLGEDARKLLESKGLEAFDAYTAYKEFKTEITFFDLVGHLWLLGLALHPDTGYIDKELHKLFFSRWISMQQNERIINATLDVEVDSGQHVQLNVQSTLQWPRLIHGGKNYLKFPISKFGNTTVKEVLIENPSSQPILVQIVLLSDYPNPDAALQSLTSFNFWTESELKRAEISPKSFTLIDSNGYSMPPSSPSEQPSNIQRIKNTFAVTPALNSLTLVMPVGYRTRVAVGFTPQYVSDDYAKNSEVPHISSTFLLIRNNLTIFDAIHLSGEGGSGLLKLGNHLPGLNSILSFDVQEKHLTKSCRKSSSSSATEPVFTVQKSFNLVNYGKLPIKISGFLISPPLGAIATVPSAVRKSGHWTQVLIRSMGINKYLNSFMGNSFCQGFGFKVLNCDIDENESSKKLEINKKKNKQIIVEPKEHEFTLRPNEAKKIHIAFTPDFSLARTSAILTILTDEDDATSIDLLSEASGKTVRKKPIIQYSLVATVPKHLLLLCSEAIPRPYWELAVYYTLVIFMVCLHLLSVISAFFDGARILNFSFYPAIVLTKAISPTVNGERVDNIEFIQHIMDSGKEKNKKAGEAKNTKQKKVVKEVSKPAKKSSNSENTDETVNTDGASWTSYLKKKFVRRDSSGSDKSSSTSGKKQRDRRKTDNKKKETTIQTKEKLNGDANQAGSAKRKLNAKSWFSSLSSISSPPAEPPPPLPSFPSAFDDDSDKSISKTKGKKGKTTNNLNNSNNSQSNESNLSLELPYKPPTKPSKPQTQLKKCKPQDTSKNGRNSGFDLNMDTWSNFDSNDDSSCSKAIWDSPITMFDTEKAMSELVKQTESFATKDKRVIKKPINKDAIGTKSSLCSFDSPQRGLSESPLVNTNLETNILKNSFSQEIKRPKPSLTPPAWRIASLDTTNSFRSATPPVVPSGVLPFDDSLKHAPNLTSFLGNQTCVSSTPSTSSWITDALLDNELTYLKDSSASWNSLGTESLLTHAKSEYLSRDQLPNESRLNEWTRFGGVDLNATKLWESSNPSVSSPSIRNISSHSVWSNERKANNNVWAATGDNASPDYWFNVNDRVTSTAASTTTRASETTSNFSLFGTSPWTPITSSESRSPNSMAAPDTLCASTASSWSQNLFGFSSAVDSKRNENSKSDSTPTQ